jgi:mannosyl-3-phosphoglycerate phosphatase
MSKKLVIFSDVDGTLLSRETYRPGPARDAIWECMFLGIDVVLVSSKNRHEMMTVRRELGLKSPFISENGGGLFIPRSFVPSLLGATMIGSYWRMSWDGDIAAVRLALRRSAEEVGVKVRPFSELGAAEIARLTGLTINQADLAKYREFDEPFLIEEETPEKVTALRERIQMRGYRHTVGGKFHHIMGNFNKGDRVMFLKALYMQAWPNIKFAAIGDAPNDLPMLRQVDRPFAVREPGGTIDRSLLFEGVTVTRGIGPEGFAEAVRALIEEQFMAGRVNN